MRPRRQQLVRDRVADDAGATGEQNHGRLQSTRLRGCHAGVPSPTVGARMPTLDLVVQPVVTPAARARADRALLDAGGRTGRGALHVFALAVTSSRSDGYHRSRPAGPVSRCTGDDGRTRVGRRATASSA